jgi:hypothetical protein
MIPDRKILAQQAPLGDREILARQAIDALRADGQLTPAQ